MRCRPAEAQNPIASSLAERPAKISPAGLICPPETCYYAKHSSKPGGSGVLVGGWDVGSEGKQ